MSWLLKKIGSKIDDIKRSRRNALPAVTKQTTARMQEFELMNHKTGSLVLSNEDLASIGIQSKILAKQNELEHQMNRHKQEIELLREEKMVVQKKLEDKLNAPIDTQACVEKIRRIYLDENRALAPGDGVKESEVVIALYRSSLNEKVRSQFQHQSSDELIEIYKTAPKFKERMGEREAKLLSAAFQIDALQNEQRQLYKRKVQIQVEMMERLSKIAHSEFQHKYEAARKGLQSNDEDLANGGQSQLASLSYSARITGETKSMEVSSTESGQAPKEVVLDEDQHENRT